MQKDYEFDREAVAADLGCDPSEVVDLGPAIEQAMKHGHELFLETLSRTNIMQMSFDRGEIITVKVIGESEASTPGDPKYDVRILDIENQCGDYHKVGGTRWVRTYDLKPVGSIERYKATPAKIWRR